MKKKKLSIFAAAFLAAAISLAGCSSGEAATDNAAGSAAESTDAAAEEAERLAAEEAERLAMEEAEKQEAEKENQIAAEVEEAAKEAENAAAAEDDVLIRVGSLKGPTSIGLVQLMENADPASYSFTMETQADVISTAFVKGDLDIVLVPANLASVLYNKTEGGIVVLDINTLGVLDFVSGNPDINDFADLSGHTIITTGAGTTPEYSLRYVLKQNGIEDSVTIEFKSEAAEVAAALAADPTAVGMLPQPFATAALLQNNELKKLFELTTEWNKVSDGSTLVTGVTIAKKDFVAGHPQAITRFLSDHAESARYVTSPDTIADAAALVEKFGIIEKAAVAEKAIPACNIVCLRDEELKTALPGYLAALYEQDPSSVGGALPEDDFYYSAQ